MSTPRAQTPPAAPASAASATSAPAAQLQHVEVKAQRASDVEERRQSTAAKIVIGREEIERYGDSNLGDVLKRLPGVTMQGRPGRGGNIRMRGLGSGYTQILLDGQRIPPGFSLDSLTSEQIERIEILRAPTAETGARARRHDQHHHARRLQQAHQRCAAHRGDRERPRAAERLVDAQ